MAIAQELALGLSIAILAAPLAAQTSDPVEAGSTPAAESEELSFGTQGRPERTAYFTPLLGVRMGPAYFGSDEMELGPSFRAGLAYLDFAGIRYGTTRSRRDPYDRGPGFGYGLSLRFIPKRDSEDRDELRGLDDVDPTLELGAVVGYGSSNFEALVDARYGFGGSDAWIGQVRLNYVARPTDRLAIRIGPRFLFGSDNYVDTYFGVSPHESAASGLRGFDPDPGLVSAGAEIIGTYRLSERWWLEGAANWQHFQGDAADSPIVQEGAGDYTEFRIGFRRSFEFRF